MIRFSLGMIAGIALCALWLHTRFLPQQGYLEQKAIIAKHQCDVRLSVLINSLKEVY